MNKLNQFFFMLLITTIAGLATFQISGCGKKQQEPFPEKVVPIYLRESESITEQEFDSVLVVLSKSFVDLLENPSFVSTDLPALVGPCDDGPITPVFLERTIQAGGSTSTIKTQMNLTLEKYYSNLTRGEDHVTELLSMFKVNNIQYAPSIHFPNHELYQNTTVPILAAPGVGYDEVEGKNGDIIKAWIKGSGTSISQISVSEHDAVTSVPVVIFTSISIEQINDPCGGALGGGYNGGGANSGGANNDDNARRGPAIQNQTGDRTAMIRNIRLVNGHEGALDGFHSELHYQLTIFADPYDPNTLSQDDDEPLPKGFKVCNIPKCKITNQEEVEVHEFMLSAWESDKLFVIITLFEYDWYAGIAQKIYFPGGISGFSASHSFRAKFGSLDTYYSDIISYTDANGSLFPSRDLFLASNDSVQLCTSCQMSTQIAPTCYEPNISNCNSDVIQLIRP